MYEEPLVLLGIGTFLVSIRSCSLLVETGQPAFSELLPDERKPFLLEARLLVTALRHGLCLQEAHCLGCLYP